MAAENTSSLLQKMDAAISEHSLATKKNRILVAISGGPDSVCLAHALHTLGYTIALAHVNYKLRAADSEKEQQLVEKHAKNWGLPVFIKSSSPKELQEIDPSLQLAARKLRYAFFEELLETENLDLCATGHHADDQLESLLLSLSKGSTATVFKSIPIKRDTFIRPMLEIRKNEILAYLHQNSLAYGIDSSNSKNQYHRNKLRNIIIPAFETINPSISTKIIGKHKQYTKHMDFLGRVLSQAYDPSLENTLDWTAFENTYGGDFVPLLIQYVMENWGLHGHVISQICALYHSQKGRYVETEIGKIIRTETGLYCEVQPGENSVSHLHEHQLEKGLVFEINGWKISVKFPYHNSPEFGTQNTFFLDKSHIAFPILFRPWKNGDKMQPLGMATYKKLSDIFVDEKYSPKDKSQSLVMEDQKGIIALSGFRIADRVKITDSTTQILSISVRQR